MRVLVSSIRLTIWPVSVRSLPETPEIDNTMTCSLFAFMDRKIFRRQLPLFPSAIAETLNIFLRISYPPLKALKNRAISPVSPLPVRKAIIASTFLLRVLGLDFFLTNQILPSTPETDFARRRWWLSRNSSSSFFFPAFAVWQLHLYSCSKTAKETLCPLPRPA